MRVVIMGVMMAWGLAGCAPSSTRTPQATAGEASMEIMSTAFVEGGTIPARFTCDGENVSPPLAWRGVPEGTRALALIADDPDAPAQVWVHWVVYDMPPGVTALPEHVPAQATLPGGGSQGVNDFERVGYGGPCPPRGIHRYDFTLYALDRPLSLAPGATKAAVVQAMQKHVLATARLEGRYAR